MYSLESDKKNLNKENLFGVQMFIGLQLPSPFLLLTFSFPGVALQQVKLGPSPLLAPSHSLSAEKNQCHFKKLLTFLPFLAPNVCRA